MKKPPLVLPENLRKRQLGPGRLNRHIISRLADDGPFMLARFGGTEEMLIGKVILEGMDEVDEDARDRAQTLAGITPPTPRIIRACAAETLAAGTKADVLGVWSHGCQARLAAFCDPPALCGVTAFDPVILRHQFGLAPWTRSLSGRRILVVHPFARSIRAQLDRRDEIETVRDLWPDDAEFEILRPPVTFAGEHGALEWDEELARLKAEVASREFDVALVAAGAYGMPVAGLVRDLGRKALHCGGVLQLAFGIIGGRWERKDRYPQYAGAFGEGWIRPDESEAPRLHERVDESAYW